MGISRRQVLKAIAATAAGGAVFEATAGLAAALTGSSPATPLVWLHHGSDDHNLLALMGRRHPSFMRLVLEEWDLRTFEPLMPAGYRPKEESFSAAPVLLLEALPIGELQSEMAARIAALLPKAKAVLLLGTAVCYGKLHIPLQAVAEMEALCRREKTPLIKLPGFPVPPHHLVGMLSHLEFFGFPRLDEHRRPLLYYGETVCRNCHLRDDLETGRFAARLGEEGCLLRLGCKGPSTRNSCPVTRWNNGENWCVGAGGPCTGCSEPDYPDHGGLGLYGRMDGGALEESSATLRNLDRIGWGFLGLTALGAMLHLARRVIAPVREEQETGPHGRERS